MRSPGTQIVNICLPSLKILSWTFALSELGVCSYLVNFECESQRIQVKLYDSWPQVHLVIR